MYVGDPLYRYASLAGKRAWQFTAFATWILGFATFQVLYIIYRTAPFSVLPAGLPGPNSFVSVIVGDCFVLPTISALIALFYDACQRIDFNMAGEATRPTLRLADTKQNIVALVIAVIGGVGTYAWWFAVKKVDWTIPHPRELNTAGFYHAIFLVLEVYIVANFILSIFRLFAYMIRGQIAISLPTERAAMSPFVLIRLMAGVFLGMDIFALALLADVFSGTIPAASYYATSLSSLISITVLGAISAIGIRRCFRTSLFRDAASITLLLVAWMASFLPLTYVYLSHSMR